MKNFPTPEEAIELYEELGLTPRSNWYASRKTEDGPVTHCCILGAIAAKNGVNLETLVSPNDDNWGGYLFVKTIKEALDVTNYQRGKIASAFDTGFFDAKNDCMNSFNYFDPLTEKAYRVGVAVYEHFYGGKNGTTSVL